jgi:hypothetical protein
MERRETIGGWLSKADGLAFAEYAAEIGIDLAALATILLVRELNHDRLGVLRPLSDAGHAEKGKRVSVRPKRSDLKEEFGQHALRHNLSPDAATSILFRAELRERWLGKCLGLGGNQIDSRSEE